MPHPVADIFRQGAQANRLDDPRVGRPFHDLSLPATKKQQDGQDGLGNPGQKSGKRQGRAQRGQVSFEGSRPAPPAGQPACKPGRQPGQDADRQGE